MIRSPLCYHSDVMQYSILKKQIRVVLVGTTHPGNIGAAARAMKTMGLARLYLVAPEIYPSAEATSRASGADDLLSKATVCGSVDEAIQGCDLVAGASARVRKLAIEKLAPRETAQRLVETIQHSSTDSEVAIVFGREHSGLTNDELDKCHFLAHIPANPEYLSLNLAAAVQIFCYEFRVSVLDGVAISSNKRDHRMAHVDEMEGLYQHLQAVLQDIGFLDPSNPRQLMRRLRRMFNRAKLDSHELNILRGILSAINKVN